MTAIILQFMDNKFLKLQGNFLLYQRKQKHTSKALIQKHTYLHVKQYED